jgi:hypothetical protein
MRALRKGQASSLNITRDMRGEARLVERAFNVGPGMLAEVVQVVSQQFEPQAASSAAMPVAIIMRLQQDRAASFSGVMETLLSGCGTGAQAVSQAR